MSYAKWTLALEKDGYLSGPEATIIKAGGSCESFFAKQVEDKTWILGYFDNFSDYDVVKDWSFSVIDSSEALSFCQDIISNASFDSDGKIIFPKIP